MAFEFKKKLQTPSFVMVYFRLSNDYILQVLITNVAIDMAALP
jgi:hypothetical protein